MKYNREVEKVLMKENIWKKTLRRLNNQGIGAWLKVCASAGFIVCLALGLYKGVYQGEVIIAALLVATSIIDASEKMQKWRKVIHFFCFILLVGAFFVPYVTEDSTLLDGIIRACSIVTVVLSFLDSIIPWKTSKPKEENDLQCNSNILEVKGVLENAADSSTDEQVFTLQLPLEDLKCILHGKCENCKAKENLTEKPSKTKYVFKKNQNASFYITMGNTISSNEEVRLPGTDDSLAKEEETNE